MTIATRLRQLTRRAAVIPMAGIATFAGIATSAALPAAEAAAQDDIKVLRLPIRTDGPKSLDPVEGSTTYDNTACSQIFETLIVNKYSSPLDYEPLLIEAMPTSDDGGKTWKFTLKEGVRFHDNACFPGGVGREINTDDVFYSLKRLGDKAYQQENWWLLEGYIVGLDEYVDEQNEADTYDYDAPVEGLRKIDDRNFEIVLNEPLYVFLMRLGMFQTSVLPREAVEMYGEDFRFNPVGTGPFMLEDPDDWRPKQSLYLVRNPNYHEVYYPERSEWSRDDRRRGLHRDAGKQVPFVDRLEFTMFPQDQPMWLRFREGRVGYIQVPDPFYDDAFDEQTRDLKPSVRAEGVDWHKDRLLDFIFRGINMQDELLGYPNGETGKLLRQAISLAIDLNEINKTFYSGLNIVYDGPIPPGLDGYPEPDGKLEHAYSGPNLRLAREKLAEAGYPDGDGLPVLDYYTTRNELNAQMAEATTRQLAEVGIRLNVRLVDFSTLIETVNAKAAQLFTFAWSSDYPDAENNLALFYGPNESPGSNHYNYNNPEYDRMYEQILTMSPGPERTEIYETMRDMLLEDVPYIGSMARQRHYLINPWLKNCRPTERYTAWYKYLDIDESKMP